MHILLINASEHVFGAERSIAALAAGLRSESCRFTMVSPGGAAHSNFQSLGIESRVLDLRRFAKPLSLRSAVEQLWRWIKGNWALYRLCRRLRPDLLHANGIQSMLYLPLTVLLLRRRVVWHVRDLRSPARIARLCARLASAIIVPSSAALHDLPTGREKVHVISNPIGGLGSGQTHPARKTDEFGIGLVGQMIPRKGHDLLLDAAPLILENVPGSRIYLVGGDPFEPESTYIRSIKSRIANSTILRERVVMLPYITNVQSVYCDLSVIVIPSRSEAFGRVALEAMVMARPVIAARTGGLAETIHDRVNGLLFDPGSHRDLARLVIELAINNRLRNSLANEGLKTAQKHQDHQKELFDAVRRVYENIMSI